MGTNPQYTEFPDRKSSAACGGGRKTPVSGGGGTMAMPERTREPGDVGKTQTSDRSGGTKRGKFYVRSVGL